MKIDCMKERDSFLGYCMVNAVTHADKLLKVTELTPDGLYEVQFIVNGVELPLQKTFKDIENQIDRMTREKALGLLMEKFDDINNLANEITSALKRIAEERLDLKSEE